MRNPRVGRWKDIPNTLGLLLFAQRIEEALFNFSLDSYKAPALNTHTRCLELIATSKEVLSHRITPKALLPIIEELASSIRNDRAARGLLGNHSKSVGDVGWWRVGDPIELRTQAELVHDFLRHRAYERAIINHLRNAIAIAKEKEAILAMTADLIVEWRYMGFSSDFIYYRARGHFFAIAGPPILALESFDTFVSYFSVKRRQFDVVLRGSSAWQALSSAMPDDLAQIQQAAPSPRTALPKENAFYTKPHEGVYITVRGVKALDARSATDEALGRLESLAGVAGLHVHRSPMDVEREAVAYEDNHPVVLRPSLPPMHREEDCAISALPERFLETIVSLGPGRFADDSWNRLGGSLSLHSASIASPDPSVQLTGLWAALESLLPANPEEPKITTAVRVLVPALCRFYAPKLFLDLHHSLLLCSKEAYESALLQVPQDMHPSIRCAHIVALPENEALRDSIYPDLKANPLLRFRMFALMRAFKSADAAVATMTAHERRVSWQVKRIYRARNLLLHSGYTPPHRDALLENLHSYFHELLRNIQRLFSSQAPPSSLNAALLRLVMDHSAHMAALAELDSSKTTTATLETILLGPVGAAV